jgi:hypothetical protein
VSSWRRARPEVVIAIVFAAVAAVAGVAVAGWPGLALAATGATVLTVLVLRGLAPRPAAEAPRRARQSDTSTTRSIRGYSQRRFMVSSGMTHRSCYDSDLRPVLEHLLAARLAERRGLNLYTDPAAAKRAFVRGRADEALWRWVDPAQAIAATDAGLQSPGIPRRKLARLIDRLEHL